MSEEAVVMGTPWALGIIDNDTGSREDGYEKFREYYDGEHQTQITKRQRQYLNLGPGADVFRSNYCPIVVDAVAEKMQVTGFAADDELEQPKVFWDWWAENRMDHQQGVVHTAACRDGDAYVIISWDPVKGIPRFDYELAFDGEEGVKCHYSRGQRSVVRFASKRWENDWGQRRLNLYYPDRMERYYRGQGGWLPYIEDGQPWLADWRDMDGTPIGIPVIHFRNKDTGYNWGKSELKDITPLQDALNKAVIDLIAAADTTAFRIYYMLGDDPSGVEVAPGVWIHSNHPPEGEDAVAIGYFPGEDLSNLKEFMDSFVIEIARVSRTPLSRFQVSSYRAAEGTLKQEESGLIGKVENRQVTIGNAWEDVMAVARRLWNIFGETETGETGELDTDVTISTVWADPETRNEKAAAETAAIKREALGIPTPTLWEEMGYTPQQIEKMKDSPEYQNMMEMQKMALELGTMGAPAREDNDGSDGRREETVSSSS